MVVVDLIVLAAGGLAALNGASFALAWADKRHAQQSRRRVPERTFHLLALVGGWLGAALAFAMFHHKTRKGRFLVPFVVCAAANAMALTWAWQAGWLPGR